ncbi:MAG: FCSD flavin-binding domain-containing protein [Pseudomonadota bacterium]
MHRRALLKGMIATPLAGTLGGCTGRRSRPGPGVVVVGGGVAGVTVARELKALAPDLSVTLVEPNERYTMCPFSNLVVAGLRPLSAQQFDYQALTRLGITQVRERAVAVDHDQRRVRLASGASLPFERLVVTPGIDLAYDRLPGYSEAVSAALPHAWQAGPQTLLLRDQLKALRNGGVVAMAIPDNPYRCPPGPYERASLIAYYLKTHKPRSKLLLLDAKDRFSKQPLFTAAWEARFGSLVEWQGRSDGAAVVAVDASERTLITDFDRVQADVINVIPPQRAGRIAQTADLADRSGWCPIDAGTFRSLRHPNCYVLGDAAIANAMPKSAFAANAQGKLAATQLLADLTGGEAVDTKLLNTCYSLVEPDYGISVAGVYEADGARWREVEGAGGASPRDADIAHRQREAAYAHGWYQHLTDQLFGGVTT